MIRRVTLRGDVGVGDATQQDVIDAMNVTGMKGGIVIGLFADVYLNLMHGIGDHIYNWFCIENAYSRWADGMPKQEFIHEYLEGRCTALKRLWIMDNIEDLATFLQDFNVLRSINEEYK